MALALRLGESVYDTFVERLQNSSLTIKQVWMRPCDKGLWYDRVDVTNAFVGLMYELGGGVVLHDCSITPELMVLLSEQERQSGGGGWFGWARRGRQRAVSPPEVRQGPWWMVVEFQVPGGVVYSVCYKIPDELVSFPPKTANTTTFTPIGKQIISAVLRSVSTTEEEIEEEEEGDALVDMTEQLQRFAGPAGDYFEREIVDLRLSMAESEGNADALLEHACSGNATRVEITTADGVVHEPHGHFLTPPPPTQKNSEQ